MAHCSGLPFAGILWLAGLTACGGSGGPEAGAGGGAPVPLRFEALELAPLGEGTLVLRWRSNLPAGARIEWESPGRPLEREELPATTELLRTWRREGLIAGLVHRVRVVLLASGGGELASPRLAVAIPAASPAATAVPVVVRSGIDVLPRGQEGVDFVVEPMFGNRDQDDRVVLYLGSACRLALAPNAKDGDPLGQPAARQGLLRYEIDHEQQAGPYVGSAARGQAYGAEIDLRNEMHEPGVPVLGSFGPNGAAYGARPSATTARYWRGMRGPDGDEWHVLTVWQDDSAWFTGGSNGKPRASDGHVVPFVVDPAAPVLRFEAPPGEQFYTTPPKAYHVPVVHHRTTYCSAGTRVHAWSLAQGGTLECRVDAGPWQPFVSGAAIAAYVHVPGQEHRLALRAAGSTAVRTRRVVVEPAHPSASEGHPRALLWQDAAERAAVRARMRTGPALVREAYLTLRDATFFSGMDQRFGVGRRRGWRSYESQASYALRNAFVGEVEGYDYAGGDYARHAKEILLNLCSIEPIGMENPLWWPGPALERVTLGFEQATVRDAAVAYSLLAGGYRLEQGHPGGLTPIEDVKIRDNLASQVLAALQFRDNSQTQVGEGDVHWALGLDLAALVYAFAMPEYASSVHGTAGLARHARPIAHWAPWPDQALSWVDAILDPHVETPGHPNIVFRSRVHVVYQGGVWRGPVAYEPLFHALTPSVLNLLRCQGETGVLADLELYLRQKAAGGLELPMCVNRRFDFAHVAAAQLSALRSQDLRSVWSLAYYDPEHVR